MEIRISEFRTHLSSLLIRVAHGENITITRGGKPVAVLMPPGRSHAEIVRGMRALRSRVKTGRPGIREMIRAGRRF